MKEFRGGLRYGALSIRNELRGINLYLVLLVVFCFVLYSLGGIRDTLAASGERMNVLELYVHFQSSWACQTVYVLGVMAVSCGTLFYSHGAAYYLIRGSRREWALGQGAYLLAMVAGYNLFLMLALGVAAGGRLTFADRWSRASAMAEQFGAHTLGIRLGVNVSRRVMEMGPAEAGALTFLLSLLVGVAAGMAMAYASMRGKGVFGVALIAVLWFGDILVQTFSSLPGLSWLAYLSPFGLSRLSGLLGRGGPGLLYGVAFFCILIAIESCLLLGASEKVDFLKLE